MAKKKTKIQVYKDKAGEFRWRMRARNGRILDASTEGFKTRGGCKHNIKKTAEGFANYEIDDETRVRPKKTSRSS